MKISEKFILLSIFLIGAVFRLYNVNWDQGHHLHPDERAIIMTVVKLQLPDSLSSFLNPQSPWNTHFFAYGSFPFYLLWFAGQAMANFDSAFAGYDQINLLGRVISAIFDLGTCWVVILLARRLFGEKTGWIAGLLYAISVLPIQLSHFFAVDTILTFFCTALIYRLVVFYEEPGDRNIVGCGLLFGLALATKISAVVLSVSIVVALVGGFVIKFILSRHKRKMLASDVLKIVKHVFYYGSLMLITSIVVYVVSEPYAIIDFREFWSQTIAQSQMTKDAFTFPYTLQYVGIPPYIYELKNIFLWGLGPLLASFAFVGFFIFLRNFLVKRKEEQIVKEIIVLIFFLVYFWIVGKFAIGFMRYMLPLYPLFCIFAALAIYKALRVLKNKIKNRLVLYVILGVVYVLFLIWPMSFVSIYASPNTRTTATDWINKYVPAGKVFAQEHWDDGVPMGGERYNFVTLPLYDQDTPEKWENINQLLSKSDYVILASNRLYVPLQKLTDCENLPPGRCYKESAEYYKKLFAGKLGFQKIAEFTDYPVIPFLGILIDDQSADESFTVYDHPKIILFQRINPSR